MGYISSLMPFKRSWFVVIGLILRHKERSVIVMDEWQEDKEIKSANPRDQFTWEDVNIYI